ncbi:Gfo/Idh/MocA family oxidoreductase [Octadecabacter sp. 1_MG-2023]|uniref:Gfo/Idh/MocA family protein n=1 Tax=unclassified Octadecabacter TaxID=196158 RepID=UPI001C09B2D1|nr:MULTISPECIES: Gfo/Idh/MocA family oxidoreductase [unclassified Octadecabacter]MBU2994389.1 Gfo/Idh/MocA family oxidoreductase [Octadecabacter sp. B2R22]MDO6734320.1 Gfo/Idh/MocA family oxidoreductase [Octadecabacter sp. 1_MG-2023]
MIRVAIIGAGIGAEHLEGYRALPDRFEVVTLCDLDTDRATVALDGDTSIEVSADLDAVMADKRVDLIDVCLPPHLHFPVSMRALEAGKHVICEKPIVRSLHEADQLEAAAKAQGRHVFPVFQYRYGKAMDQLMALRKAGLAGKPYVASVETHWNRNAEYYSIPWRGTWAGESGGSLLGHAIHAHDLICHVMGPVADVFAFADTRVNDIETEDCASLSFRLDNGALATSSVTLGAGNDTTRLRFCFDGLTAESGTAPYAPAQDVWTFTARAPVTQDQIDDVLAGVAVDGLAGFAGYLEATANMLDSGGDDGVTLADGRRSIELVTAIYTSARNREMISLPLKPDSEFYTGWMP